MNDENKNKFGDEPTNVRRASRARNRTVLLTPEATQDMRAQLANSQTKAENSGSSNFLNPQSGNQQSGQPVFRSSSQLRDPSIANRKTEVFYPGQDLKDAINKANLEEERLDFGQDLPEADSEFSTPGQLFSQNDTAAEEASSAPQDKASSLEEINKRLQGFAQPAGAPPSSDLMSQVKFVSNQRNQEPVKPVVPNSFAGSKEESHVSPVFKSAAASATSPSSESAVASKDLAPEAEVEAEDISDFADDFAPFEPAEWDAGSETPVAEAFSAAADLPAEEDEFVDEATEDDEAVIEKVYGEQVVVESVSEEVFQNLLEEEEQEEMVKTSSQEGIHWTKETPLVGFLISMNEADYGRYYELHAGRLVITSEPVSGGSYLLLNNESVSPMHAVLRIAMNGTVQILDQLSESGTKIVRFDTGEELELSGDKSDLNHGDVIILGDCMFSICLIALRESEG